MIPEELLPPAVADLQAEENYSPPAAGAIRLHFIDGLRGLAMMMVLVYHCWLFSGRWTAVLPLGRRAIDLASPLGFGHIGVNLFLVLSGFCLYWPFVKGGGRREPTLWEFAQKRCRRILPPYYVTLALFGGLALFDALRRHDTAATGYTLNWLWIHALMAHNLRPGYVLSIDGALWSLALEFQLYILFPVLVEAYRRFPARRVLWTALLLCTAYRVFLVRGHFLPDDAHGYVLAYSIFGRGFEFALGMWAALVLARRHTAGKWPLRLSDLLMPAAVVAGAVAGGRHGHFQALTDALWGLVFAGLLLAGSRAGSRLHGALSARLPVSLGLFSYSVYLIHLPLVIVLGEYAAGHFSGGGRPLFMLLFTAPLMLALGYVFHCLFEKPFMRPARPLGSQ